MSSLYSRILRGHWTKALGVVGLGVGATITLAGGSACSFILKANTSQCTSRDDCIARGPEFANTTCGDDHICVVNPAISCTKNQQCLTLHNNDPWTCRKSDHKCVQLTSPECRDILQGTASANDLANDDTIFIGALSPLGPTSANFVIGKSFENGVEKARREFYSAVSGLPPVQGTGRRPLAVVFCSEDDVTGQSAVAAAKHLVEELQVPAVLGPFIGGNVTAVFNQVTFPAKAMNFSWGANDAIIAQDKGDPVLFISNTAYTPTIAEGQVASLGPVEKSLKSAPPVGVVPSGAALKMMLINKGDSVGGDLANNLNNTLKINGKSLADNFTDGNYVQVNYGTKFDPATPDGLAALTSASGKAIDFAPHLILFASTAEVTTMETQIESGWKNAAYRPRYLHILGGYPSPPLIAAIKGATDDWRKRVGGLYFNPGPTNKNWGPFKLSYAGDFNTGDPKVDGAPNIFAADGYDAYYLAALSIIAAGDVPLSGTVVAGGVQKLVPAPAGQPARPRIDVGVGNIAQIISAINAGGVDLQGAGTNLDSDVIRPYRVGGGGSTPHDITLWCLNPEFKPYETGAYFSAETKQTNESAVPFTCYLGTTGDGGL